MTSSIRKPPIVQQATPSSKQRHDISSVDSRSRYHVCIKATSCRPSNRPDYWDSNVRQNNSIAHGYHIRNGAHHNKRSLLRGVLCIVIDLLSSNERPLPKSLSSYHFCLRTCTCASKKESQLPHLPLSAHCGELNKFQSQSLMTPSLPPISSSPPHFLSHRGTSSNDLPNQYPSSREGMTLFAIHTTNYLFKRCSHKLSPVYIQNLTSLYSHQSWQTVGGNRAGLSGLTHISTGTLLPFTKHTLSLLAPSLDQYQKSLLAANMYGMVEIP